MMTRTLNAVLIFACICSCFAGIAQGAALPSATCPDNLKSCTANDVTSTVLAVQILKVCYYGGVGTTTLCTSDANCPDLGSGSGTCADDVCTSTSDNIFVQLTTAFNSTSAQKYDLGLYVSGDGGTVQEPSSALVCSGAAAQAGDGNLNAYPDADTDLFLSLDPTGHSDTPTTTDTCGDLSNPAGPVNWTVSASVRCSIVTGPAQCGPGVSSCLLIPSCRVWQQNANHPSSCQTLADAGTGSKCDCTPLEVTPQLNPCATKTCNDNDPCTTDACQVQGTEGVCVFTPGNAGTVCREAAGVCDVADHCDGIHAGCDDLKLPGTSICRPSTGQCDAAESCTGSSNNCPADGFSPSTTTCTGTSNGGACDGTDSCDGSGHCVDGYKPATTTCRASTGACDVAESCTGSSGACPVDGFQPSTTTCTGTSNGGACDASDSCDGAGHCVDGFKPATTTCRASTGECDPSESCTGSSGACPADGFSPSTTTCTGTSNGGACDGTDSCDGSGHCVDGYKPATTTCRPSAGECDLPESCSGSGSACPADAFKPGGTTCTDDGNFCTSDVCTGSGPACTHPSNGTCNTQIAPTATTCSDFASGTAANLDQASYLVKGTSITSLSPGVMFYYTKIVAPSSAFSFSVSQSNAPLAGSCANWAPLPVQGVGQINLYDASCGNRAASPSYDATTGTATMSITGATPGETLIVGIKYSISNLKGQAVCRPHPTEKYTFSDSAGGTDSLIIVPKN